MTIKITEKKEENSIPEDFYIPDNTSISFKQQEEINGIGKGPFICFNKEIIPIDKIERIELYEQIDVVRELNKLIKK